jgi:hypothetical protein
MPRLLHASVRETMQPMDCGVHVLTPMALVVVIEIKQGPLWSTGVLLLVGGVALFYGLTREPLRFNRFNPWKKPLPVWAARVVYIPMALFFFYFALRSLLDALR